MSTHGAKKAARSARVADIIVIAAEMSRATTSDILGDKRPRKLARVRQACCMVARRAGHSYAVIGSVMNRDHSSIIHNVQAAQIHLERDPEFRDFIEELETRARSVIPFSALPRAITAAIPDRIEPLVCVPRKDAQRARNDFRSDAQPDSWLMPGDNMIVGSAALAAALKREGSHHNRGVRQ